MRKHFMVSLLLLALVAGCSGRSPQPEPTQVATAAPTVETVAQPPTAAPTVDIVAQSPLPAPTAMTTLAQSPIATPTMESVAEPTAAATATTEATSELVSTPSGALPQPKTTCTPGMRTPAQTEGPYYTQNPPEDANLYEEGMAGTRITVTGYVFNQDCESMPGARVDFWQADAAGVYDNQGYTLRGYQLTDDEGRYVVTTVIPGEYPGRTPHIHVKVTAPNGPTLTSQLYFPGAAGNESDRIFDPGLIVEMAGTPEGQVGYFNFVIDGR